MDIAGVAQVFFENTAVSAVIDMEGHYTLKDVQAGHYTLVAFAFEHGTQKKELIVNQNLEVNFHLHEIEGMLSDVVVRAEPEERFGLTRLNAVDGMGIYEGRKTEVLVMKDIIANTATNNARQVFSRITGLNIWESDCAGIQLGVGGRGLSPNRSSNFNTRQNGIEMSADALGYPESYYSPPLQAVKRIEIVRGAASLQYGTQFGGLINFVLNDAPENKRLAVESAQTMGSYGYFNSYNSIGGTLGRFSYFGFVQYRTGDCWRCNSEFDATTGYLKIGYRFSPRLKLSAEYTTMHYLARQAGGLTDLQFADDPRASYRDRNWFQVNWHLPAVQMEYKLSANTSIDSRLFGLVAQRQALGNLARIDRADDPAMPRELIDGTFGNIGNETRILHRYNFLGNLSSFLGGFRLYQGNARNLSGDASAGSDADFAYVNNDSLGYDYDNKGSNVAFFAENIFSLTPRLSITPGLRFEHIVTSSDGYFRPPTPVDLAGNPIYGDDADAIVYSNQVSGPRQFVLGGIGISYKQSESLEFYGNISQNYKSVSYTDIRVTTPTLVVDEDITDESGYSVDLGMRGTVSQLLSYELTGFLLKYNSRIGSLLMRDNTSRVYRFQTNVGDARNVGLETFAELDVLRWLQGAAARSSLTWFSNFTVLHTEYVDAPSDIEGNRVEFSPAINLRSGVSWKWERLGVSAQVSYLSQQYTDATNAPNDPPVPGAVEGAIPAYYVADLTASYVINDWLKAEGSINNLTDNMYFTRRATGYPGPGIIPSDGRTFYITISGKF